MHSVRDLTNRVVPTRFAEKRLDEYRPKTESQTRALVNATRLADGIITNLVLIGPPGVGKSHLAAAVVNKIFREQVAIYRAALAVGESPRHPPLPTSPMWTNVADLIVALRMEMRAPADDRDAAMVIRMMRSHPSLVVLDDLGREKVSDWTGEIVYSLLNARYEERLPTLVTSNLAPVELAASPYWPVISRLAEDGELVRIDAPDHRLAK